MRQREVHQPHPLCPLPLAKGKGKRFERGALAPLKHPVFYAEESQREAKPLLSKMFPLSLKGEGDAGGEGLSDWAKSLKSEAKNGDFEN